MSQIRIEKLNSLFQKILNKILREEFNIWPETMLTINSVQTTPDLHRAKVFLSVFPVEKGQLILKGLKKKMFLIQKKFNQELTLKKFPRLILQIDQKLEKVSQIEKILDAIKPID